MGRRFWDFLLLFDASCNKDKVAEGLRVLPKTFYSFVKLAGR